MAAPTGFRFEERRSGEIVVFHGAKVAAILRGARAATFLDDVGTGDPQAVMARVTGNYKRGNERLAGEHPRNRRGRPRANP